MKKTCLSEKFSLEDIRKIRNNSAKQYETIPLEKLAENTRCEAQKVLNEISNLPYNPTKTNPSSYL